MPRSVAHQKKVNDRNARKEWESSITKSHLIESCMKNAENNVQNAMSQCKLTFNANALSEHITILETAELYATCTQIAGNLSKSAADCAAEL